MATPHFKVPFQVGPDNAVATVEQDSLDEVIQSVTSLLRTHVGERLEVPDYGIPDPTFATMIPRSVILTAIGRWEPRAVAFITDNPDALDDLLRRVNVSITEAG